MADQENENRREVRAEEGAARRNPGEMPAGAEVPAKTAADSMRNPEDRADDLYDDSPEAQAAAAQRPEGPMEGVGAVDATIIGRQNDCPDCPTSVPVDYHDPLSGKPSIHPVGTSVGAASGAAAGVAVGALIGGTLGPIGAAVGAAAVAIAGAFAGGAAGRQVSESLNPSTEEHYWRAAFPSRDYVRRGYTYEDYRPAFLFGERMRVEYPSAHWSQVEDALRDRWQAEAHAQRLPWHLACPAAHDGWDRLTPREPDM